MRNMEGGVGGRTEIKTRLFLPPKRGRGKINKQCAIYKIKPSERATKNIPIQSVPKHRRLISDRAERVKSFSVCFAPLHCGSEGKATRIVRVPKPRAQPGGFGTGFPRGATLHSGQTHAPPPPHTRHSPGGTQEGARHRPSPAPAHLLWGKKRRFRGFGRPEPPPPPPPRAHTRAPGSVLGSPVTPPTPNPPRFLHTTPGGLSPLPLPALLSSLFIKGTKKIKDKKKP